MAINWMDKVLAAGVGVVDELAEDWDASVEPARTESFKTAQDIGRLLLVGGGLGLQAFMPRQAALGDTLSTAAMPLLVKSAWGAVAAQRTTSRRVTYAPQRRNSPAPARAASRYPAPVAQDEFKNVRLV